jgi:hypothetical protein
VETKLASVAPLIAVAPRRCTRRRAGAAKIAVPRAGPTDTSAGAHAPLVIVVEKKPARMPAERASPLGRSAGPRSRSRRQNARSKDHVVAATWHAVTAIRRVCVGGERIGELPGARAVHLFEAPE